MQVVSDFLCMNITYAYHDAQNMPAGQDKTLCHTHLAFAETCYRDYHY